MAETVHDIYAAAVLSGVIEPDPAQEAVLPILEDMRLHLAEPAARGLRALFAKGEEMPRGLYLWGDVGRGKSMLMDLFVGVVQAPKRRVHFHAFMQEIHAAMHKARKAGVVDALKPVADAVAAQVRLLAFDELQINDITDAMIVGRLFERLLQAGVVLVITSNRAPDDLYLDGLNRQLFVPFIDMLAAGAVYFTPADAAARRAVERLWTALAGGEGEPLVLRVQGRELTVPEFRNGVARASFWDLCGKALGPADYLALAGAIRVLVLENVPCLSRTNYNEAKRFVTLIDALYEARVGLVMSAAELPERLYLEGTGSFEFARTASRIHEMQSDGWGLAVEKS